MRAFLYIDVDAFFATVEQAVNPALVGRPVMVGGLKHERGVVACPSYEARALGVKTGTALYDAARMIPDGIFLKGDFQRYEHYSQKFYKILEEFSPDIQKISQDEACLDISGSKATVDSCRDLATEVQSKIKNRLSLSTSIGVAPSRSASKIASEHNKPYGLTILHNGNINDFFLNLPIRNIPGVGRVTEKILHEMGIRTAGQLSRVPEKYLKTVFGINGLKIAAYSRGEDGIPLRDHKAIRSVSRETGFPDDITDRSVLLAHYYYLLERATAKLRSISRKAATIKIKFRYSDFQTVEAVGKISPISNDETAIFPIVEAMFRRAFSRRLGIRLAGITLSSLKTYIDQATFLNDQTEKQRRLLESLDFTRGKSGYFALNTGRTWSLAKRYKKGDTGYVLRTPSLSQ